MTLTAMTRAMTRRLQQQQLGGDEPNLNNDGGGCAGGNDPDEATATARSAAVAAGVVTDHNPDRDDHEHNKENPTTTTAATDGSRMAVGTVGLATAMPSFMQYSCPHSWLCTSDYRQLLRIWTTQNLRGGSVPFIGIYGLRLNICSIRIYGTRCLRICGGCRKLGNCGSGLRARSSARGLMLKDNIDPSLNIRHFFLSFKEYGEENWSDRVQSMRSMCAEHRGLSGIVFEICACCYSTETVNYVYEKPVWIGCSGTLRVAFYVRVPQVWEWVHNTSW
ncbi:hypothetical protein H4582DRAFT_2132109 [Lactarius indigo]|nr:hypothetical protein H4582DRAFT_2132109 [Lactarius indigo]